jgi:hypothetical protein
MPRFSGGLLSSSRKDMQRQREVSDGIFLSLFLQLLPEMSGPWHWRLTIATARDFQPSSDSGGEHRLLAL